MVHSPVLGLSLEKLRDSQPTVPVSLCQVILHSEYTTLLADFCLSSDLPDPVVMVSSGSVGTLAVGERLELTCWVTVVEHLTPSAELSIEWSGGSVGGSGVIESETRVVNETASKRTLIFSSLNTSHGGQYTCQAVINIAQISLMKTGNDIAEVMVQSEYLSLPVVVVDVCLSPSVPSPEVIVTPSERELVSGSPLSLSCSVLPPSVDTSVTISSNWTTPEGSHDDTVNTTLVISSVETADSGEYFCSAVVSESSGSQYVVDSDSVTDTASILVSK